MHKSADRLCIKLYVCKTSECFQVLLMPDNCECFEIFPTGCDGNMRYCSHIQGVVY